MTSKKRAYQNFLESSFWKELRTQCLDRDGNRCRYCNAPGRLQAHHTLYPDDWYQTTLDHLITLCVLCHEKEHGIHRPPKELKKHHRKFKKKRKFKMRRGAINKHDLKTMRSAREAIWGPGHKRNGNFVEIDGRLVYAL